MKIDVANTLTIILGLLTLIGAIYRLAQAEVNINSKISDNESKMLLIVDALKDNLNEKINPLEGKLEIHTTKYEGDKEYIYIAILFDS